MKPSEAMDHFIELHQAEEPAPREGTRPTGFLMLLAAVVIVPCAMVLGVSLVKYPKDVDGASTFQVMEWGSDIRVVVVKPDGTRIDPE